jgi:hypothetical protein
MYRARSTHPAHVFVDLGPAAMLGVPTGEIIMHAARRAERRMEMMR